MASLLLPRPVQLPVPWWLDSGIAGSGLSAAQGYALGTGIRIGMVEQGIDLLHGSLIAAQIESELASSADMHGTQVAALIVGHLGASGGGAGAASAATLVFTPLALGSSFDAAQVALAIALQVGVDVVNNSWGAARPFADNFRTSVWADVGAAIALAADTGRAGLGTSLVFAAGNGRMMIAGENRGDDANFHNLTNARQIIAVAATGADGNVAYFSSPGATVLLAAPGHGLISAAQDGAGQVVSGTSFAAPLVTGTIALMLQVNPALGWRDVQDILAMTAKVPDGPGATANAGEGVNGGGLVFDRDIGFGILDAEAAVRLARTWRVQSTSENEAHVFQSVAPRSGADGASADFVFAVPEADTAFRLDWVSLTLTLTDARLCDLRIMLTSPAGTETLIAPNLAVVGTRTWLDFSFASVATRGEDIAGDWTVRLSHPEASTRLAVYAARLDFYGDRDGVDDVYVFTRSFAALAAQDPARRVTTDTDGGLDTLNFAAAAAGVTVNLATGNAILDGVGFSLQGQFETVFGTIGADEIIGDARTAARLFGAEGNDRLVGGAGNDIFDGGRGADQMTGGAGNDVFIFNHQGDRAVEGAGGGHDRIRSSISLDLRRVGESVEEVFLTGVGNLSVVGTTARNQLYGNDGANVLRGNAGDDRLSGGAGADTLTGGAGADTFVFALSDIAGSPDVIVDFARGVDRITFDVLSAVNDGVAPVTFGLSQGHGAAIWQEPTSGKVLFDPDGAGGRDAVTLLVLMHGAKVNLDDFQFL